MKYRTSPDPSLAGFVLSLAKILAWLVEFTELLQASICHLRLYFIVIFYIRLIVFIILLNIT